jgi:hypothetical protein
MTIMEKLERDINNVEEASFVCRGEWCRTLEPVVDKLAYELSASCISHGTCASDGVVDLERKIRNTYRHIPTDKSL